MVVVCLQVESCSLFILLGSLTQTTRINELIAWVHLVGNRVIGIKSVGRIWLGEELVTTKADSPKNTNHVASHGDNLFKHLSRDDVLVSSLGGSLQLSLGGRLSGKGKSGQRINDQIHPEELDSLKRGVFKAN